VDDWSSMHCVCVCVCVSVCVCVAAAILYREDV